MEESERVERGWKNRFIASRSLNTEHVLRVVFEKVGDVKIVLPSIQRGGFDMKMSYNRESDVLLIQASPPFKTSDPKLTPVTREPKPLELLLL